LSNVEIALAPSRSASPSKILELSWGHARTAALVTALELDVFTHIASGRNSPDAIASAADANKEAVATLLLALAGVGLLVPDDDGYRLSDDAAAHLVKGKPGYLGDLRHLHRELNFRVWPRLTESVRSGRPCEDLFARDLSGVWKSILPYLDALGVPAAQWIAELVASRVPEAPSVLDVGCGSGIYGRKIAHRVPEARITGLDRPELAELARSRAEEGGLGSSTTYLGGDLYELKWGKDHDVVLLSNVLHGYGPEDCQRLLGLAWEALRPGGLAVIHEFVPDHERPTDNPVAALFGLEMLLTSSGAAYSADQYERWLRRAGFSGFSSHRSATGPTTVLIAFRGGPGERSGSNRSRPGDEEVLR
jgi:2-polyprenyl-3-methyl-5-hydroxy-6-metoxy-1,4-benzoquinol methylase